MPRHSPSFVVVHVVWATERRQRVLVPSFDARLTAILGDMARSVGCVLLRAGCASDHVHALVCLAPGVALARLVQRLKGGSAHESNHHALLCERLSWQVGYWAESVSPSDIDAVTRYLRSQREHHEVGKVKEPWECATE
jgi:putative transposase